MWRVGLICRPGETIRVDTDRGWVGRRREERCLGRRSGGQGEKEEGDGGMSELAKRG